MIADRSMAAARYELPHSIAAYAGEIIDVDAHDSIPVNFWVEEFGSVAKEFVDAIKADNMNILSDSKETDDADINAHNVWHLKMEKAPGAIDFDRRLDVLDYTGVRRQLMYPGSLGLFSLAFFSRVENPNTFKAIGGDRVGYARKLVDAYNDWCIRVQRDTERLRPVAALLEDTPEAMYAAAKRLIGHGIRALWIPTDRLPGGVSPADPSLDPLWALMSDTRTPMLTHVGAHEGTLKTNAWRDAPVFDGWKAGNESRFDPWTLSNFHLGAQVFLSTMILGCVFDRHPNLIYGSAEFAADWVGPLSEHLDMWYTNVPFPVKESEKRLKLKPSEYFSRNVRVAPFDFENVGRYIDRYGLEDCYCYASDYPHHEGGKDPMGSFARSLEGHSERTYRKFFVENGKALLPD